MKLGFLMIVLTLLESGEMSAAFVNTDTLEDCERRAKAVRAILEQRVPIKDLVCRSSAATFEPFSHGAENAGLHSYAISFDAREAWITPRAGNAPCDGDSADARAPPKSIRYCATSSQKLISEGN